MGMHHEQTKHPQGHGHAMLGHGLGHAAHGHGHPAFARGPMAPGRPLQVLYANTLLTHWFARVWMVVSAIALCKIASSLALGARVKAMNDLRDDLTEAQRQELMADIWSRVERKRMSGCCSGMMRKKPVPADK